MRAIDILIFCMCINAAIGLVDVSGMGAAFTGGHSGNGFLVAQTGEAWSHSLTGINALSNPSSAVGGDVFTVAASWVIETTFFAIGFVISAALVIPAMMNIFYFPLWLAAGLQGLIYWIYIWAYIQWKSGKSLYSFW